jgi:nucleoid-associated protein YgaU
MDVSRSPSDIEQQIRGWINATTGKQLRLVITGTKWNIPVRINNFLSTPGGGHGDINYTISLSEWRDLVVQESSMASLQSLSATNTKTDKRPSSKPKQKTYTVKAGDTMWKIAQKLSGNGGRWPEMWSINKSRSRSKDPDLIYPGEVFLVPSGW